MLISARSSAADTPDVSISGVKISDGVSVTTTTSIVMQPIFVENTTKSTISSVRVELTDLIGPDSHAYAATLRNSQLKDAPLASALTLDVPGLQAIRIELSATVPLAGVYQSSLALVYGDKRYSMPLKVTRTSVAPTVRMNGLLSAAFEGFAARSLRFSLQETNGVKVVLLPPQLVTLSVKDSDKFLQASYETVKTYRVNADGSENLITTQFDIAGNATTQLRMEVDGLSQPGEYTASLNIGSADGNLAPQTLSIFVKRSLWLAIILIALGVGASMLIRSYTRVDRPRLLLRRRVLLLETDIQVMRSKLPDEEDQALLAALVQRLQRTQADFELGIISNVDDVLNDVNAKLSLIPDWSNLRKKVEAVQPPSIADPVRPALDQAEALIRSGTNATPDQLTQTGNDLRTSLSTLDAIVRGAIISQIKDAQDSVKNAPNTLSDALRQELQTQVLAVLIAANDAAQKTPPDVGSASKLIDEARRSAARILVNDLEEKLVKPDEITAEKWAPLEKSFSAAASMARVASNGDQAMNAYSDADRAWLIAMIEAAESQARAVKERANSSSDAQKAFAAKMDEVLAQIAKARAQIRNGELASARETFNDFHDALIEALKALPPLPQPKSMDADAPPEAQRRLFSLFRSPRTVEIPGLTTSFPVETTSGRLTRSWSSVQSIERKIARRDWLVAITVGIIAVVMGVYLLWVGNLTWGSMSDMIAAVLWGLGVHQAAGNAVFAKLDLTNLEGQLTGTSATAGANAAH